MIAIQPLGGRLQWFHPDDIRHLEVLANGNTMVTVFEHSNHQGLSYRRFETERLAISIAQDFTRLYADAGTKHLVSEPFTPPRDPSGTGAHP